MEGYRNPSPAPNARQRIALFQELLTCGNQICSWVYSEDLHLLQTNSQQRVLNTIFEHTGCLAYMKRHFDGDTRPLVLSSHLGIMWCAACEQPEPDSGLGRHFHVIGPVLNTEISQATIDEACLVYGVSVGWHDGFSQLMNSLPVTSAPLFFQVGIMLHYCATGEKLAISDIAFQQSERIEDGLTGRENHIAQKDRIKTYHAEQAILRNVREGNLDYSRALEQAGKLSYGIRISTRDPIDQMIISSASFVTLCTRAAIDGGMSPDAAYALGDSYIQSLVGCKNVTDIRSVNHTMYEDFVRRVHQLKAATSYSKQIQSCVDYIELHLEDDLSLKRLARRVGYAEYYLSNKFRQEVGVSVKDYIKKARIERAKALLTTTDLPISQIAEQLQFCSSSYCSNIFREQVGMLPQAYRHENQRV